MTTASKENKDRVSITLDPDVKDKLETWKGRETFSGFVNRLLAEAVGLIPGKITMSLDPDVLCKLEDVAKAQRDSKEGMANRMLAIALGLMPREKDKARIIK